MLKKKDSGSITMATVGKLESIMDSANVSNFFLSAIRRLCLVSTVLLAQSRIEEYLEAKGMPTATGKVGLGSARS